MITWYQESLQGVKDGVNKSFTLPNGGQYNFVVPVVLNGRVLHFRDELPLRVTEYDKVAPDGIVLGYAPQENDLLWARYAAITVI